MYSTPRNHGVRGNLDGFPVVVNGMGTAEFNDSQLDILSHSNFNNQNSGSGLYSPH
jgi:hypothetical protein